MQAYEFGGLHMSQPRGDCGRARSFHNDLINRRRWRWASAITGAGVVLALLVVWL
jgi:hypothetical protein